MQHLQIQELLTLKLIFSGTVTFFHELLDNKYNKVLEMLHFVHLHPPF